MVVIIVKFIKYIFRIIRNRLANIGRGDSLKFTCNICGKKNVSNLDKLSREVASCTTCGSTVRMRAIIHVLSTELFGESFVLKDFPVNKEIKGVGMSDWDGYANPLSEKLDYTNTFYHQEPMLDITKIPEDKYKTMDFIISSDVYEHVLFPVSHAFENTKKLLKSNGVFVFTVPYTKEGESTVEHFGQLHDFEIKKHNDSYILKDVDDAGNERVFDNLIFHGGPGSTLEMRVFSEKSLMDELNKSGLKNIKIYNEPYLRYGIYWNVGWSLPIAARL